MTKLKKVVKAVDEKVIEAVSANDEISRTFPVDGRMKTERRSKSFTVRNETSKIFKRTRKILYGITIT